MESIQLLCVTLPRQGFVVLKPSGWQARGSVLFYLASSCFAHVIHSLMSWEVDESGMNPAGLPLSGFAQAMFQRQILYDELHQRGFLHRLDVPSSGLILVALSYKAYYDLQFQLSAGLITRDYTSLCHGWIVDRDEVRASVTWSDARFAPSKVKRPGPGGAKSFLKTLALLALCNLSNSNTAMSLLGIRIATGRKHQIRVHLAHIGHPTVSDGDVVARWWRVFMSFLFPQIVENYRGFLFLNRKAVANLLLRHLVSEAVFMFPRLGCSCLQLPPCLPSLPPCMIFLLLWPSLSLPAFVSSLSP